MCMEKEGKLVLQHRGDYELRKCFLAQDEVMKVGCNSVSFIKKTIGSAALGQNTNKQHR